MTNCLHAMHHERMPAQLCALTKKRQGCSKACSGRDSSEGKKHCLLSIQNTFLLSSGIRRRSMYCGVWEWGSHAT